MFFNEVKNRIFTSQEINFELDRISKKFNITNKEGKAFKFNNHLFRHFRITNLLETQHKNNDKIGVKIDVISKYIGHCNIEQTLEYSSHPHQNKETSGFWKDYRRNI